MGSPINPFIANLFMEESEVKALSSAPSTPNLWLRFVDDTFVIQEAEDSLQFSQYINTQEQHLQFTMEEPDQDGSLPFLDTWTTPGPNNILLTTVFRKPTHTDQYLHWDSNHFIGAKHSVFNTLACKAEVMSTTQQTLRMELEHIRKALHACHFPPWTLNKLQPKFEYKHYMDHRPNSGENQPNHNKNNSGTNRSNNRNISIVAPYRD